jgi:flagellar L-ring protein precursor FlgH
MKKRFYPGLVMTIVLLPGIVFAGGIGSIERSNSTSGHLEDRVKEYKQELSSYRYEGSLWKERSSSFYMDNSARRINDIVTVKVDEISNASQSVSTKTSRDTSILANIAKFLGSPLDFGMENLWGKDDAGEDQPFIPEIASSAQSSHSGSGKISGSGKLLASIAAKVIDVMPNGNLIVEGRKEVTIDKEKRFIILSGIVRPEDIGFDNTVFSSKIADARIEYKGSGVISDKQRPGIFHRIFDWVYPL